MKVNSPGYNFHTEMGPGTNTSRELLCNLYIVIRFRNNQENYKFLFLTQFAVSIFLCQDNPEDIQVIIGSMSME